jgi:hypothetical protein
VAAVCAGKLEGKEGARRVLRRDAIVR